MTRTILYAQWALAPYCIDAKLRALRVRKHLTLARLAAETGLSTALLSKLETGRMIPTLPTLMTISRVYGVGLEHFFSGAEQHSVSITRKEHLQAKNRGSAVLKMALNAPSGLPRLVVEAVEMPAGSSYVPDETGGEACVLAYVLDGEVEVNCGGLPETLTPGDCAYIESQLPVSWVAKHANSRVLVVRPGVAAGREQPKGR